MLSGIPVLCPSPWPGAPSRNGARPGMPGFCDVPSSPSTSDPSAITGLPDPQVAVHALGIPAVRDRVVQHAILEIMPGPPQLVVSGINYGENLGTSVTVSGTVGAAMEGASLGIPSIAMSLQLLDEGFYLCSWRTMYHILDEYAEVRERR